MLESWTDEITGIHHNPYCNEGSFALDWNGLPYCPNCYGRGYMVMSTTKIASSTESKVSVKADTDKLRYDLIPPKVMDEIAQVYTYGANKYGPRNWEAPGFEYGRLFGAIMRHLWLWWAGQEFDPESGLSHLAHAASTIMFLMQYRHSGAGTDNRP